PVPQNRWTVFFRIILAIPALFVVNILSNLSQLLAVFSWFIALVIGRVPEGIRNFAALALRMETQTYADVMLLTGRYTSFNVGIQQLKRNASVTLRGQMPEDCSLRLTRRYAEP